MAGEILDLLRRIRRFLSRKGRAFAGIFAPSAAQSGKISTGGGGGESDAARGSFAGMVIPASTYNMILGRLDRNSANSLLTSLVRELTVLHQSYGELLARVAAVEVLQGLGDRVLADLSPVTLDLPTSVTIDAAFPLPVEHSFHAVEYDHAGTAYRWTGPNPAFHFEVMMDRTRPLDLRLHYIRMFENPQNQPVKCFVDGAEIETSMVAAGSEFEVLATLPSRNRFGATSLTFICPSVRSPTEAGVSSDQRRLGLTFRWLKIDRLTEAKPAPEGLS